MEKGFREADHIIEYDLNMPTYASASPNPHSSVAWWFDDPYLGTDNLHIEGAVWHASGGKNAIATDVRTAAGKDCTERSLPGRKILRLDNTQITADHPVSFKKGRGRPVRCINERKDTFDFMVQQRFIHMKVGFKKDGLITAFDDFSITDGGTTGNSFFGTIGDQGYGPYIGTKCLNIRQKMDVVDSNRGLYAFQLAILSLQLGFGYNGNTYDRRETRKGPDRHRKAESPWTGRADGHKAGSQL